MRAKEAMIGWLDAPREWLDAFGEIARFGSRVAGHVYSGRVFPTSARACVRPGS